MSDPLPDIEKRILRMVSERSPVERLRMASSMFETGKRLVIAGLLMQNNSLNNAQLRARIFMRLYGDTFTREEIENIVQRIPHMQLK